MTSNQVHVSKRQAGQDGRKHKQDPIVHGSHYRVRTTLHQPTRHLLKFGFITLLALVSVSITFALGQWQLSRAQQKEALQQRMIEQRAKPPLGFAEALQTDRAVPGMPDALLDREITLRGHWLPEWTVLLDNRPMNGKSGFLVVTPLRESITGRVVLVQRGWLQRDFTDRTRIAPFTTSTTELVLTGRVVRAPSQTLVLSGSTSSEPLADASSVPRIRQNLQLDDFKEETQLPLWDRTLLQTDPAEDGLLRDWPAPNLGVDKHHGYAFQWFGLSALIAVLYVWFQLVPRFRTQARST